MIDPYVFVFGSNLAGRHGRGSARAALVFYGAVRGIGEGRQGRSYAIPTKGHRLEVLSLEEIRKNVDRFLSYAAENPDVEFNVVKVGTGLAGYKSEQMAPMFKDRPRNVHLHEEWQVLLEDLSTKGTSTEVVDRLFEKEGATGA